MLDYDMIMDQPILAVSMVEAILEFIQIWLLD